MKLTTIYLTEKEKTELESISKKYKVSLSTIADKIVWITYVALKHSEHNGKLWEQYIEMPSITKKFKTTIKPKCWKENKILDENIKNKDLFTTNCLRIYIAKNIKDYVGIKECNDYYNKINKELMDSKEQFWNYNSFIRSTMRSFRENKDYYKRKLAEQE